MKDLQKKLMNANPKSTFGVVMVCFAASMGLLAWVLLPAAPGSAPTLQDGGESKPPLPDSIPTSTPLLGIIHTQLGNNDVPPFNPFAPSLDPVKAAPRGDRRLSGGNGGGWRSTSGGTPGGGPRPVQPATPVNPQPGVTNNPRPTPSVTLAYKGYMTRVDGVALAQIENTTAKTVKFYAAGDEIIPGFTLQNVGHHSLTLRKKDGGDEQTLALRETVVLQ